MRTMTISVDARKFGFKNSVSSLLLRDGNFSSTLFPSAQLIKWSSRYCLLRVCCTGRRDGRIFIFFHPQGPDRAKFHKYHRHKGEVRSSPCALFLTLPRLQLGPVSTRVTRTLQPLFTLFRRPARYMALLPFSYTRKPAHSCDPLQKYANSTPQTPNRSSYPIFPQSSSRLLQEGPQRHRIPRHNQGSSPDNQQR